MLRVRKFTTSSHAAAAAATAAARPERLQGTRNRADGCGRRGEPMWKAPAPRRSLLRPLLCEAARHSQRSRP
ncbi:unnamed protein product [Lota lota]